MFTPVFLKTLNTSKKYVLFRRRSNVFIWIEKQMYYCLKQFH